LDALLRASTRERFGGRCGYCGVHEDDAGATLTVDHYRPRARRGDEQTDNLVYACVRCNEHKGSYWYEEDPPHTRLLHPGHDDLSAHLDEAVDGRMVGKTSEGRFFVHRLQLNRPQLVAYRCGLHIRQELSEELAAALARVTMLEQRMEELSAAIDVAADTIERD
jgi:hypothetical protein